MLRPTLITAAVALLCTGAMAQAQYHRQAKPVTGPIRQGGTYHVATGTWTRGASLANATGPSTIYNNTCLNGSVAYFSPLVSGEFVEHHSRIPSASGPRANSIFYGSTSSSHRFDDKEGCGTSYLVNGFQFAYCSGHIGPVDFQISFANLYSLCSGGDPVNQNTFVITGLQGGTAGGGINCWVYNIDVSGNSAGGFVISADGDGSYNTVAGTGDTFGYSNGPAVTTPIVFTDYTGPISAGNYTWTGGGFIGPTSPCTGTDGTIWDNPINLAERGTGMDSADFFRDNGGPVATAGAGCYSIVGPNPHSDFWLALYSTQAQCKDPVTVFCVAGADLPATTCPCNNPPSAPDRGCDNNQVPQVGLVAATGGSKLRGSGVPSVTSDTLSLDISNTLKQLHLLWMGSRGNVNIRSGAGRRCVTSGSNPSAQNFLKRTLKKTPTMVAPATVSFTGIRAAQIATGGANGPVVGETYYYYASYRNTAMNGAGGTPGCPGLNNGFNNTNAGAVTWQP